jgi:mannose-6-phosphate isomerase-like protein (cupin superfamily)
MITTVPRLVVKPGEGRSVWLGGMGVVYKISVADAGGAFATVEHPLDPGRLVLPHVHLHVDEYSYVLEGTVGARVGDHEVIAGPGSYLIKPRGFMHTFWNAGPGPARPGSWKLSPRQVSRLTSPNSPNSPKPETQTGGRTCGEIRGDLLFGMGRRTDLQVQPEATRSLIRAERSKNNHATHSSFRRQHP